MHRRTVIRSLGAMVCGMGIAATAQFANAQTPQVVKEKILRPIAEVQMREETETVVTPEYSTKMQEYDQVIMRPVTRVAYQPRVHQWWNPFVPTYTAWHPTVVTQWEPQVVKSRMPVTTTQYRTETRVVQRPTRVLRMVEEEQTRIVQAQPAPVTAPLVHQPYVAPLVTAPYVSRPAFGVPAAPIVATPAAPIEIARQPSYGGSLQSEDARLRGGLPANDAIIRR